MSASPTDRYRRVDAIFDALLDVPPDEQMAFAERAAGDDPEIHAEVLRLLHAHRREGFLESPLPLAGAEALLDAAQVPELRQPERVGPWRIVRLLGRGGMGTVYLGERADGQFEQRAAVKLIQRAAPGMLRRFLEERRILALLEHPGIARLLEGGVTADGLPYFAMELVEGEPLVRYCDEHELSVARRLELVVQVCEAVSYAHQHLVIHRDLKPSNILVTADGRPKLLDFGIAKLLSGGLGSERTETQLPAMTPEFAAPEQVRGEAVSTATDVYALGVLLYLLLAHRYPYDVRGKSFAELTRIVCEEEPTRPSSAAPDGRRELRGDLDLIVLTALRKDPARRYQTPAELADDLRRYRDGRPIRARPDSPGYRLAKFAGRNRGALVAAAALVALLAGGLARERGLRHRAELETQKAKEVGDWVVGVFDVADPLGETRRDSGDVTARALLERGTRRVDSSLAGQPEIQAQLRGVFGRAYTSLGLYPQAIALLRQSLEQHTALFGPRSLQAADDRARLGEALMHLDRYDEAEPHLRAALETRRSLLGRESDATAEALDRLATSYQRQTRYADAEPLFREALAIRRGLFGDTAVAVATSFNNLGVLLFEKGAYPEAEAAYREALAIDLERLGERHALTAEAQQNLAQVLQQQGRPAPAESLYRAALATKRLVLGNANPSVTINLNNLSTLLMNSGRLDEAETMVREALVLDRRMFGNSHSYVAQGLGNLATVLKLKGEFREAEQAYEQALAIDRERLGPAHRSIAADLNNLGNMRRALGDDRGGEAYFREAIEQGRRALGDDHLNTTAFRVNLGRSLQPQGKAAETEAVMRAALTKLDTARAEQHQWWVSARTGLGLALVDQGRGAEARDLLEPTVSFAERVLGAEHVRTNDARLALGRALVATGEYARAEPLLRHVAAVFGGNRKAQPIFAAQSDAALAELRRHRGSD